MNDKDETIPLNTGISVSQWNQIELYYKKCENIESDEKNLICTEKCEAAYDKCQLSLENNEEVLNDDQNKDYIESEKSESN